MKKRIAIAIIKWLLRFVPDHALLDRDEWNEIIQKSWNINQKAEVVVALIEPLKAENDALRKQVEDQKAAYDALIEEMEELL